jgi:hypothetical protein
MVVEDEDDSAPKQLRGGLQQLAATRWSTRERLADQLCHLVNVVASKELVEFVAEAFGGIESVNPPLAVENDNDAMDM